MSKQIDTVQKAGPEELTYKDWKQALTEDNRLLGQQCSSCGHQSAAPKAACAQCGSQDLETIELPTTGEVYTVTHINAAPTDFEAPYYVGLVSIDDARVMAHFDGEVEIGDEVELSGVIESTDSPGPLFG